MRVRNLMILIITAAAACTIAVGQDDVDQAPSGEGKFVPAPPIEESTAATESPSQAPQDAEKSPAQPNNGDQRQTRGPFGGMGPLLLIAGVFIVMYWFMGRSRRKQEAKRREMLANLKKGDKVTTIGGIVGTVMEVREDEVTIKVDESNNTRMKFARWSIRGVGEEAKKETQQDRR